MNDFNTEEGIRKLESKWKNKNCPICNGAEWLMNEELATFNTLVDGNIQMGPKVQPLVTCICRNCGYTFFLNKFVLFSGGENNANK